MLMQVELPAQAVGQHIWLFGQGTGHNAQVPNPCGTIGHLGS